MNSGALLAAGVIAGTASLVAYVSFWHGENRPSEQWVARMAMKLGAPNLPVLLLSFAVFWYANAVLVASTYLDGPAFTVVGTLGLTTALGSIVLSLVWSYRAPRRLLPTWYQDQVDAKAPKKGSRRSRVVTSLLLWLAVGLLLGAYGTFRAGDLQVAGPLAVTCAVCFVFYVFRE